MVLFIGPLYSGKTECAAKYWRKTGQELSDCMICTNAQEMVRTCKTVFDLRETADRLAKEFDVVTITEIGSGMVPVDAEERAFRENAGRFSVLLAERADEVYRVVCGIPTRLK